jgi:hypothetical protein
MVSHRNVAAQRKVLVAGGNSVINGPGFRVPKLYDPLTGTWTATARYSTAILFIPRRCCPRKGAARGGRGKVPTFFPSAEMYRSNHRHLDIVTSFAEHRS